MYPGRTQRELLEDDPKSKETLRRRSLVGKLDAFIHRQSSRHLGSDYGIEHRRAGRKRVDDQSS